MWWKLTGREFESQKGEGNRQAMKSRVMSGEIPGLLAYRGSEAVGWCAMEPRADYPRLGRSRILKKIDDRPVWSITCFYTAKSSRGRGLTLSLIRAGIAYIREQGGAIVEAYPVDTPHRLADASVYYGLASTFKRAGFIECARHAATRPIMRLYLDPEP